MDERRLVLAGLGGMAAGDLLLALGNALLDGGLITFALAAVGIALGAVTVAALRNDEMLDLAALPLGRSGQRLLAFVVLGVGVVVLLAGLVVVWLAVTAP